MKRILYVEDSIDSQLIARSVLSRNYQLVFAGSCEEGTNALLRSDFSLILLDVLLPDGDGFDFCRKIRETERGDSIGIIFVSGRADIAEKLQAFDAGADDYIVKPFDPLELKLRVDACLNRMQRQASETIADFRYGNLTLDSSFGEVRVGDLESGRVDLRPIEFRILNYLVRREGRVVSRDELISAIWGQDVQIVDRTVDRHICTLRKKLGDAAGIETVAGAGYRMAGLGSVSV